MVLAVRGFPRERSRGPVPSPRPLREGAEIPVKPAGKTPAQGRDERDFACGFRGRERLLQHAG